jgi:hypothetical protein
MVEVHRGFTCRLAVSYVKTLACSDRRESACAPQEQASSPVRLAAIQHMPGQKPTVHPPSPGKKSFRRSPWTGTVPTPGR